MDSVAVCQTLALGWFKASKLGGWVDESEQRADYDEQDPPWGEVRIFSWQEYLEAIERGRAE